MDIQKQIECVDKAKLLDWLDTKANDKHYGAVYAEIVDIFKVVKSGAFDDNSLQSIISQQAAKIERLTEQFRNIVRATHSRNTQEEEIANVRRIALTEIAKFEGSKTP